MWSHIAPELATRYRVARFDFRGYGDSPATTEPYRNSDDVAAVLEALRLDQAHLVAASMGATAAMEFALAAPDRVRSLTLLATGLPGYAYGPQMREYFAAEAAALERGDVEAVVAVNLEIWVRGAGRPWTGRTRAVAEELRAPLRTIAANQLAADDLELGGDPPARGNLERIAAPTLVVIAESDPADMIAIGELVAASVPGARTVRMADTAHLPALERPGETLTVVTEFLGSL